MKYMYRTKKNSRLVAILTFFGIFLCFFLIFSTSFAYFFQNRSATGNIQLSDIDFCVGVSDAQDQIVLPGSETKQEIFVANSRDAGLTDYDKLCDILFRFSIDVAVDGQIDYGLEQKVNFSIDSTKFFRDGGIFYSLYNLPAGKAITIFDKVKFDETIQNQYQSKNVQFVISVEAIQTANQAYKELWQDAPSEWKTQIANNTR